MTLITLDKISQYITKKTSVKKIPTQTHGHYSFHFVKEYKTVFRCIVQINRQNIDFKESVENCLHSSIFSFILLFVITVPEEHYETVGR